MEYGGFSHAFSEYLRSQEREEGRSSIQDGSEYGSFEQYISEIQLSAQREAEGRVVERYV